MSGYLNLAQHTQLLGGINPNRVGKDGKGFAHVEAYEIRAHLNRIFGFARWSADLMDLTPIFETENSEGKWTVCYRATVALTVCAEDGTVLATYTEAATGEAKNQPHRGDAHDLALKTAESQALKRSAVNLGDAFGLSLYRKGSLAPLVKKTLVVPPGETPASGDAAPVDAHITEPLPQESEQVEDNREVNDRKPVKQEREPSADTDLTERDRQLAEYRDRLLAAPADASPAWFARVQVDVAKAGLLKAITDDGQGNVLTLGALLQQVQRSRKASA